jgi:predicted ATPase
MSAILRLSFLGIPQVQLGDESVSGLTPRKVKALLIYLAHTAQPHSREHLAELLFGFGDRTPEQAAANLRAVISRLRRKLKPFILTNQETVAFDTTQTYWLDTAVLTTALSAARQQLETEEDLCPETAGQLSQALRLYRGDFLSGFNLRDARGFDEWVLLERERLHRQVTEALQALVAYHLHRREYAAGISQARRLLRLDNLQESAHRQLMLLLARAGKRSAALAQYEACRRTLREELGVAPGAQTTRLYERIRAAESGARGNLPLQLTPFVGRTTELAQISRRLDDPDCRLLTLVGPGGIGKTRLALEAVASQSDVFLNGVYFVPLAAVSTPEILVSTIANALHFSFYSKEPPRSQLLNYLREKELLLVLDNFEHLLDGAKLISEILQQAPRVKILVTSRERLNLRCEWLFDVRGLPYPEEEKVDREDNHGALQLFAQSAIRLRPDFSLTAERANASRLCRLVEGMPLAIELAAARLRSRSCSEIVAEMEQNLDLLTTSLQDVPARHRSVRAAFAGSWQALSEAEQRVFRALSLFRGGFGLEAARQVAGASRQTLDALVAKSLLRSSTAGRYDLHELLRQYAAEMLAPFPQEKEETQTRHGTYYATYLHQKEEALRGKKQKEALAEIGTAIENARAAWQHALTARDFKVISRSLKGLFHFYDIRSWLDEGREAFARAATVLKENEKVEAEEEKKLLLGQVLTRQGWFCFRLGLYESAHILAQESLTTLCDLGAPREEAFALLVSGAVADEKGEYAEARVLFGESRNLYQAVGDRWGMAAAFEHLGDVARMTGEYEQAKGYYEQSQSLFQEIGDPDRIAGAFNSLGSIAGTIGAYDQAKTYFERSLCLCREIGDRFGVVSASHNLSNVAYLQGDYIAAKRLRQETLSTCREIGFRWGVASSLRHLGDVLRQLGELDAAKNMYEEGLIIQRKMGHQRDVALTLNSLGSLAQTVGAYEKARAHYQQALQVAMEIQSAPVALAILGGWGEILAEEGAEEQALQLLTYVLRHPATEKQTQDRVIGFLAEFYPRRAHQVREIPEKETLPTLETMAEKLLR